MKNNTYKTVFETAVVTDYTEKKKHFRQCNRDIIRTILAQKRSDRKWKDVISLYFQLFIHKFTK